VLESLWETLLTPVSAVFELIDGGGPFVGWIVLCGVLMWTLVVERLWYFQMLLPRDMKQTLAEWNSRSERVVESFQRDRGTTFRILLPVLRNPVEIPETETAS